MVALALEILWKSFLSMMTIIVLGKFFDQLYIFGESELQTAIVLAFYVYCSISLFSASKHKLFHVLAVPVFTQFLHLFQKYSFPAGANSIWRLLPFVILNCYFLHFSLIKTGTLSNGEKLFLTCWTLLQAFFLVISPNFEHIAFGGFLLFLATLPGYFAYLRMVSIAYDFAQKLEMYLCTLYVILGVGTFGLVVAAAGYKGSDNLLATRNITDTNVTMAYFILLWPFVLLYTTRNASSGLVKLVMTAILLSVVIFSFSRGAVLLIIPYVLITSFLIGNGVWLCGFTMLAAVIICSFSNVFTALKDWDMAYFWTLRFGDLTATNSVLGKLQQTSGRAEIHEIAYSLFLLKPLTGHGTGSFEVLGPGYREAHSLWYTLLAENGLVGLTYMYGLLFNLVLSLIAAIGRDRNTSSCQSAWFSISLLIILLAVYL